MITWSVDLYHGPHGAGFELDRLIAGPEIMRFETALAEGTSATEGRVHVISGYLKSSVSSSSNYLPGHWEGTIKAARHPGVYELARGDTPTRHHPEGRHYFFDPGGPEFEHDVREALWDWVTGGMAGPAPVEELGPWSGGY